ncbi:hypothetical protein [Prevotella disiens]|uniref:hypothetical protein n=1 Tax=Prevotella disiens TaxID=28130 RepID=UPI002889E252|nr:hypothetical protein [Prevotella disiens]
MKIKKLPYRISQTGNDLETSGLLGFAVFCLTKNAYYSVCKDNTFLPNNGHYDENKYKKQIT